MGKKSSRYEPYPPCNRLCHMGKCDKNSNHTLKFALFRGFVHQNMSTRDRRKQFVDYKKTIIFTNWLKWQIRLGMECYYCHENLSGKTYHVDHYYPLHSKGKNKINNMVVACPSCNLSKGAKDPLFFKTKKPILVTTRVNHIDWLSKR